MLNLFLQHHLETAAHDSDLFGIRLRRLRPQVRSSSAAVSPSTIRRIVAVRRRRGEHLIERRDGVKGEPELR